MYHNYHQFKDNSKINNIREQRGIRNGQNLCRDDTILGRIKLGLHYLIRLKL